MEILPGAIDLLERQVGLRRGGPLVRRVSWKRMIDELGDEIRLPIDQEVLLVPLFDGFQVLPIGSILELEKAGVTSLDEATQDARIRRLRQRKGMLPPPDRSAARIVARISMRFWWLLGLKRRVGTSANGNVMR